MPHPIQACGAFVTPGTEHQPAPVIAISRSCLRRCRAVRNYSSCCGVLFWTGGRTMQRIVSIKVLVTLVGIGMLSALLAGCGQTSGSAGSPQPGTSSSATSTVSSSPPPATPSSTTAGASGQQTSEQVTLTLNRQHYSPGDTITVTIHNGLSQMIWSADHKTACTVVAAERLQNGQWVAMGLCRLETPTRMVALPAASATVQSFATIGWPSGTYRVTLSYGGGDEGAGSPSGVAYSVEFTIG